MKEVVVLLLAVSYVLCSGVFKCPKQDVMSNFNITRFTGRWYEIERTFYLWELTIKCLRVEITMKKPGQLYVMSTVTSRLSGDQKVSDGIASQGKRDPSIYQYKVSSFLPNQIEKLLPGSATYQVLDTDYDNFAIIWSCTSYGLFHRDMIWIWGRHREIDVTTRANVYAFLSSKNIDTDRLILSSSNCTGPY